MSEEKDSVISNATLDNARKLVDSIEGGDLDGARSIMDDIASLREMDLFCEMGKLTRELHDSLNNFKLDTKMSGLAENEIPDAKERLNHVIAMTEEAADKTLTAVETALPLSDDIKACSLELQERWSQFKDRKLSADEFRELSNDIDDFFPKISSGTVSLNALLNEILMAQGFQDLTGQIIRRVINLVHDVEEGLVDLIKMSGNQVVEKKQDDKEKGALDTTAEGPVVPGVAHTSETLDGQDDVDDLLSSLGF
ncbi:MAG: protein phosphatase CheZ [Gammaproteobacteria bacterium]|nr:protein phosphatase CheZ [Gammaproteobacteria bacterium]